MIKKFRKAITILAALVIIIIAFFKLSPYPSVWIVRYAFNKSAVEANDKLSGFVPSNIQSVTNIQYDKDDVDAYLDSYYPAEAVKRNNKLPVIVWTHGGGLISGNKNHLANYCKILASNGYTVFSIDYTVAPAAKYPTPIKQLNKALSFIATNADQFLADTSKIILAGDSGGSMIAATAASVITNPQYAELTKVEPGLRATQLKGLILYCGIYDVNNLKTEGSFGGFLKTVLWAYFGKKDISQDAYAKTASVINYITPAFPPVFISAGNKDPLLQQSVVLSDKLKVLKVPVHELFFKDSSLNLQHEYQFNMDNYGKLALDQSIEFLKSATD